MLLSDISGKLDEITGINGSLGYGVIIFLVMMGHYSMNASAPPGMEYAEGGGSGSPEDDDEEEKADPRNFTAGQLAFFDGRVDESYYDTDDENRKPIYLALNGTVFDVTKGRDFYGPPEGPYAIFAGKECGIALAKMSFEKHHIGDVNGCADLNFGEKAELDSWIEKFTYYRGYPVLGKLVPDDKLPNSDRLLSIDDMKSFTGAKGEEIPSGYCIPPIYVGVAGKVFDCSFGGASFYGADGGYNMFAGKEVSKSLAKMSFNEEDQNNLDFSDVTDKQKKVLEDWLSTFEEKKKYPIVGMFKDFPAI